MSTLTFNNANFFELTDDQLMIVDGGYWYIVALVTLGAIAIAAAPVLVGAAIVGGVSVGVAVGSGLVMAGTGMTIVGKYGM